MVTPLKRGTSSSPRLRCSSGFAACCRSSWTSPSSSRFTTTAATRRNQCHTQFLTPPVPKPSENISIISEDTTKQQRGRPYRGTVEMYKHTRTKASWDDVGCCSPSPPSINEDSNALINKAKIHRHQVVAMSPVIPEGHLLHTTSACFIYCPLDLSKRPNAC